MALMMWDIIHSFYYRILKCFDTSLSGLSSTGVDNYYVRILLTLTKIFWVFRLHQSVFMDIPSLIKVISYILCIPRYTSPHICIHISCINLRRQFTNIHSFYVTKPHRQFLFHPDHYIIYHTPKFSYYPYTSQCWAWLSSKAYVS